MSFTAMLTLVLEQMELAAAGTGGRTVLYRTGAIRVEACDRQNVQEHVFSNDVSAQSLALSPLGLDSATASNLLTLVMATYPIQLQIGASGGTLSNVTLAAGTWVQSALYVTTSGNATRVVTAVFGGSNAALTVTML